jgi:GTP-binding protein EngB required for normal cell division
MMFQKRNRGTIEIGSLTELFSTSLAFNMHSATGTENQVINNGLLLLAHLICVDGQIHYRELKLLEAIATKLGVDILTEQEIEKIFSQDESLVSWEQIITTIPESERSSLIWQGLVISHIDGFYSESEKLYLNLWAKHWGVTSHEFETMLTEAQQFANNLGARSLRDRTRLSVAAQFLQTFEKFVARSKIEEWVSQMPKQLNQYLDRLHQEMLLAGPDYETAVQHCARIAAEDYQFVQPALTKTEETLQQLANDLNQVIADLHSQVSENGTSDSAKELITSLKETCKTLNDSILREIAIVQQALLAKQRTLQYFTIAFMGKTKAGKSTLHAVITGDGWDAIGVGKQRTTRFNRVYEWKNIRIIDTPGIGAPGGKSDEEIAQSILDEADTICYVVTNDSIQEVEFQFLKLLKEKSKPLIVLLNLKHNLLDPRRRERFLKQPNQLFQHEGPSGIGGHLERIKRYAQEHYANDFFDIVPVMLLAAQLSRDEEYQEQSKALYKASHLQDFLDSIRISLLDYGAIRRSQTLLGSTVGSIESPQKWMLEQSTLYQVMSQRLVEKKANLQNTLQQARKDTAVTLQQLVKAIFQDVVASVPRFAEENWETDESDLKRQWEKKLKTLQFEEKLKLAQQSAYHQYQDNVAEAIQELGTELEMLFRLQADNFNFWGQNVYLIEKDFIRVTGMVLMASGAILGLFFPPLGLLGLVGGLLSWASNWFKSRDQRRREAVQKISASLCQQLEKQQQSILNQVQNNYSQYCDQVETQVSSYFDCLIQGLKGIGQSLDKSQRSLGDTAQYLNKAYAKRIVDWASHRSETLTDSSIQSTIRRVDRKFGDRISIDLNEAISLSRSINEIQNILQEKVHIQEFSPNRD